MPPKLDGNTSQQKGAFIPPKEGAAKRKYERNVKDRARKKANKLKGLQGYDQRAAGRSRLQSSPLNASVNDET